jgi:hypothetical protein
LPFRQGRIFVFLEDMKFPPGVQKEHDVHEGHVVAMTAENSRNVQRAP